MRYTKAIYNGKLINLEDFHLKAENRAFRYGDGFFESIVTKNRQISLLHYHIRRINKAFFAFDFIPNMEWTDSLLEKYIHQLLSYSEGQQHRIRLIFWRAGSGLYMPDSNRTSFLMTISALTPKNKILQSAGIYQEMPLIKTRLSSFKTLNSLPYVMAGIFKAKMNWEEVILLSHDGFLGDGGSTNVFWIKDNELYTPDLETGCIEGVMRAHILEICKSFKLSCSCVRAKMETLEKADAVFFTNVSGIYPLKKFGHTNLEIKHPLIEFIDKEINII